MSVVVYVGEGKCGREWEVCSLYADRHYVVSENGAFDVISGGSSSRERRVIMWWREKLW